ncbi:MAG: nitrous oxide-stimulated promoter family protein [Acidobacteria bacterium]|nr:nitrous oxide-stimulated promoter family protein [Acidobacteriota bacterium]
MLRLKPRLERERRTIEAMIEIFCRDRHASAHQECDECSGLLAYAERRLEKCPFQEEKPPCANCPIHCYQPGVREQVKAVMRYSGPRMLLRHPIFILRHWIDGFKSVPEFHRRKTGNS